MTNSTQWLRGGLLFGATFTVWLALASLLHAVDATADRLPVPDAAKRQAALKIVRDIFKNDLAQAITPKQFSAVASEIIKAAGDAKDDPAGQFALMRRTWVKLTHIALFQQVSPD